jgi:hypothetical protein
VVISLFWERFDWRSSRLFRPRQISCRVGGFRRTISGATLASAVLLAVMGVATFVIGVSRDSMPSARGWQEDLSATVQHWGSKLTHALTFVPGWVAALLLLAVVVLLARRGLRQLTQGGPKGAIEVAEPVELTLLTEADREVIRDDRGGDAVHARDEADYATQEV